MNVVVEGHLVSQDVTTDPDRNTVLSVVGEVKDWDLFKSSVNLHDFNAVLFSLSQIVCCQYQYKFISFISFM